MATNKKKSVRSKAPATKRRPGTKAAADATASDTVSRPKRKGREVPRTFAFHWGTGQVVEEAAAMCRYTEPAIQLLEYDNAPGHYAIRFCYYNHDGRFQRSPMMLDSEESLEQMRAALAHAPKLRALLKRLVT
jgi:hypothetical protein